MRTQPAKPHQKHTRFECAARACTYVMFRVRFNARTDLDDTLEATHAMMHAQTHTALRTTKYNPLAL